MPSIPISKWKQGRKLNLRVWLFLSTCILLEVRVAHLYTVGVKTREYEAVSI